MNDQRADVEAIDRRAGKVRRHRHRHTAESTPGPDLAWRPEGRDLCSTRRPQPVRWSSSPRIIRGSSRSRIKRSGSARARGLTPNRPGGWRRCRHDGDQQQGRGRAADAGGRGRHDGGGLLDRAAGHVGLADLTRVAAPAGALPDDPGGGRAGVRHRPGRLQVRRAAGRPRRRAARAGPAADVRLRQAGAGSPGSRPGRPTRAPAARRSARSRPERPCGAAWSSAWPASDRAPWPGSPSPSWR